MKVPYRYIYSDPDRHGSPRLYFWRGKGHRKTRIHAEPSSEAFALAYQRLLVESELPQQDQLPVIRPNTLRWLAIEFFKSAAFKRLGPRTQHVRRQVIEAMLCEPVRPDAQETFADFPLPRLTTKALRVLRDRKLDLPEAANVRVKALRRMFKWALNEDLIKSNPARDLDWLENASEGFHTWTDDEIRQFEAYHPIGSKARLALCLLMWLGVRRSDVVGLGRQHVRDGVIRFTAVKNARRKPVRLELPIVPELQAVIDATDTVGDMTFLTTQFGRSFSVAGFGNWFRDRCNEAELPHCSAHGLRKATAVAIAEGGASPHQLGAALGWVGLAEPERYTRAASRAKMARSVMSLAVRRKDK